MVRDSGSAQEFLRYLRQTGELFFPRICASCWAYGRSMEGGGALCRLCDRLVRLATLSVEPAALSFSSVPIYTAGRYEYELARCILAFKDGGRTDLTPYLVSALGRSLRALLEGTELEADGGPCYLVPLPSDRAATRRRGYAPAPLLASALVAELRSPLDLQVVPLLEPVPAWRRRIAGQSVKAQKTLGKYDRQRAMRGKLRLGRPLFHSLGRSYSIRGSRCILVDDVVTTGASVAEAQRILREQGAQVEGAIAVARVPSLGSTSTSEVSRGLFREIQ